MKAHVIHQFKPEAAFETVQLSKPAIKPGHVIIRVEASSVNPLDYKLRKGYYAAIAPSLPAILHGDVAGVVEEVAPDIKDFKPGDEVFGCAGGVIGSAGALAEFMLADAKLLAKKPQSISLHEAAALPLVSITAWEALFSKIQLTTGQKILIHAGTGGVGHIALQLAKWAGAEVYTTISSPEKALLAKSLGAKETIDYHNESVKDYVQRLTEGRGFDIIFDTVGGDNLIKSFEALALYGTVITIQANTNISLSDLHLKSGSLHVVLMLIPLIYNMQRERHGNILTTIAKLVDEGKLKPLIDAHQFTFEEVGKAHALLESGKAIGKVILKRVR